MSKEADLARALKWQKENPERRKEIRAKWIANNLEQMRAIRKAWKAKNVAKVAAERAAWMKAHPEVRIKAEAARRTRKTQAGGSFTTADVNALYAQQHGVCPICRAVLGSKFHRDHVVPVCKGGTSNIDNIQLLCPPCNMRKGSKHASDELGAAHG